MSCDVVMLAGPFRSSTIVYNFLKSRFDLRHVIIESLPSRAEILRNRMRKLGVAAVLGQLCFRSLVVPYLRFASRSRMQQIDSESHLDLAAIPDRDITNVDSVNSPRCVARLKAGARGSPRCARRRRRSHARPSFRRAGSPR